MSVPVPANAVLAAQNVPQLDAYLAEYNTLKSEMPGAVTIKIAFCSSTLLRLA
jgi:hypothetical protein